MEVKTQQNSSHYSTVKNVINYFEKGVKLTCETAQAAAHSFNCMPENYTFFRTNFTMNKYKGAVCLPFMAVDGGIQAYSAVESGIKKDFEGALYSLLDLGILIGDQVYTGVTLAENLGLIQVGSKLSQFASVLPQICVGISVVDFAVTTVKTTQTILFWKKLSEINTLNSEETKEKIEEIIGEQENLWKEAKVSRRTSEKATEALKKLRHMLKTGDTSEVTKTIDDIKTLCKRKTIMNGVNLVAALLTIAALVVFIVGFAAFPPLPFILLALASMISIGTAVYDAYYLEKGLFTNPDSP